MKLKLIVAALAATLLGGCVVLPAGHGHHREWHDHGWHGHDRWEHKHYRHHHGW